MSSSLSFGASYYFSSSTGSDAAACSYAAPCKTLGKLGDKIVSVGSGTNNFLLACGDVWDESAEYGTKDNDNAFVEITSSGTDTSNRLVIGAYELGEGGAVDQCDSATDRPKISGGWSWPQADESSANEEMKVLRNNAQDYITIQDIWFHQIDGTPLGCKGGSDDVIYQRHRITGSSQESIAGNDCDIWTIKHVYIEDGHADEGSQNPSWPMCYNAMGSIISCGTGCDQFLVEYNVIKNGWGEGIGHFNQRPSGDLDHFDGTAIIRYNVIGPTRDAGIHVTGWEDTAIYGNLIYGYDDKDYFRDGIYPNCTAPYHGIYAVEGIIGESYKTHDSRVLKIYNNIILGMLSGVNFTMNPTSEATVKDTTIVGNTAIDNNDNYIINIRTAVAGSGNIFKNNLSVLTGECGASCEDSGNATVNYFDIDYNYWAVTPRAGYQGGNDKHADVDGSPDLSSMTNYRWPADFTLDGSEVQPKTGSPALSGGVSVASYNDRIDAANFSTVPPTVSFDTPTIGNTFGAWLYFPDISGISPIDGGTNVALDADISWINADETTSVTVYFDEDEASCPPAVPTQVATGSLDTSYDPGTMAINVLNCWRVDSVHPGGTETGSNLSFTTAGGPPPTSKLIGVYDDQGVVVTYDDQGVVGR
ncbi:MAG: hypothetical protein ACXADH_09325 [Candidatus Kariarchaeaceae archaeon]